MDLTDTEIVRRIFCALISAFCLAHIALRLVGEKRRQKWFQKRTRSWFFNRRGFLGEHFHFGRPATKEGVMVLGALLAAIALTTYIIFIV